MSTSCSIESIRAEQFSYARLCEISAPDYDWRGSPAHRKWLGVLGQGRRLGVPGLLDGDAVLAVAARRRRLRLAPVIVAGPAR